MLGYNPDRAGDRDSLPPSLPHACSSRSDLGVDVLRLNCLSPCAAVVRLPKGGPRGETERVLRELAHFKELRSGTRHRRKRGKRGLRQGKSSSDADGAFWVRCPALQVEDWKFPQTARHNITGFNVVRRFSLLKMAEVKKIRSEHGPVILRLGKVPLVRPTDQVFPRGVPEQFTLVFTLLLKKKTIKDNVYLLQISDKQGYPQFSLDLNGPERSLVLRARATGAEDSDSPTGCVFDGEGVQALLDFRWHKVALSVREDVASLHVDCSSIETKPLGPRGAVTTQGHTLLGVRALDGTAVEVGLWAWSRQVMLYCDPSLAIQEACCEIPGARVSRPVCNTAVTRHITSLLCEQRAVLLSLT
ncbi:collagen alpha-1(XVI) chain [Arapaima gigas]